MGKKCKKKQAWMTVEVLKLCNKPRELKQHEYVKTKKNITKHISK